MNEVYYGLASANGIESFIKDESSTINTATKLGSRFGDMIFGEEENKEMSNSMKRMLAGMVMAARANELRRAVVYRAILKPDTAKIINEIYRKDPITALLLLKSEAIEIALARTPMATKYWEQIPNPDLDPYS